MGFPDKKPFGSRADGFGEERRDTALQHSDFFRLLAESSPDVLWLMDETYQISYVSPAFTRMYGYSPDEIATLTPEDLLPPESVAIFREAVTKRRTSFETDTPDLSKYCFEMLQRKKCGSLFWTEVTSTPYLDDDGRLRGVIGTTRDISKKKEAQDALAWRMSFERLVNDLTARFLGMPSNQIDDGINEALAAIGSFTKVDRAYVFLMREGTSVCDNTHEWCAQSCNCLKDIIQGLDLKTSLPRFWKAISRGKPYHISDLAALPEDSPERRTIEPSGVRSIMVEPLLLDGRLLGLLGIDYMHPRSAWSQEKRDVLHMFSKNLTLVLDRKRSEEALAKQTEEIAKNQVMLSLAVSMSQVALWEMDIETKVLTLNDQFYALYGTTAEQEGGYRLLASDYARKFAHPDDAWLVADEIEQILASGEPDFCHYFIHRIIRRDWEIRHMAARYQLLKNGRDDATKIVGTIQDITARKINEENLYAAKVAAESASQAKSEFLANMSHEIRTPLNGMLGMLQLMQSADLNEETADYLETATLSGKRLAKLLEDILDLSSIEARRMSIVDEPLDVREVVDSVEKLFTPSVSQAGLTLYTNVSPDIPLLSGDANRLHQILNNLVGNAIKFTETGSITIDISTLASGSPDECHLLFRIEDTGIGIPDDRYDDLFQPFTQLDGSFTRRYEGAGLGLSITKKLLDMMGGHMSVASEPGEGTTFFISMTFPVLAPNPDPEAEDPAGDIPEKLTLRALLVEDEWVNQIAIARLAEKCGCSVTTTMNGLEAIAELRNTPYDVIIMDVQMPIMDGVEATKAIRMGDAGGENRDIPIIAFTAFAMPLDKKLIMSAGMNGYLTKPVTIEQLRETLYRATR